jgi:hypothetical protein
MEEARQRESVCVRGEGGRKDKVVDLTSVHVRMRANVSAAGCAMLRMHLPAWIVWVGRFYYSLPLFSFDSLPPVSALHFKLLTFGYQ